MLLEVIDELRIVDPDGDEAAALAAVGFHHALDAILRDRDFLHLALADAGLELAVGNRLAGLQRKEEALPTASSSRTPSTYHMVVPGAGRGGSRRPRGFGAFPGSLQTSDPIVRPLRLHGLLVAA